MKEIPKDGEAHVERGQKFDKRIQRDQAVRRDELSKRPTDVSNRRPIPVRTNRTKSPADF